MVVSPNKQLKKVVLQEIHKKKSGIFELSITENVMTYSQFKKMAQAKDDNSSVEEIEKTFWNKILQGELDPEYYAIDNEFSLFRDETKLLNLNHLTDKTSLIHMVSYFQLNVSSKLTFSENSV